VARPPARSPDKRAPSNHPLLLYPASRVIELCHVLPGLWLKGLGPGLYYSTRIVAWPVKPRVWSSPSNHLGALAFPGFELLALAVQARPMLGRAQPKAYLTPSRLSARPEAGVRA
jgi:hypothetical protein